MHFLRKLFQYSLIAFLVGVGFASFFHPGETFFLFLVLVSAAACVIAFVYRSKKLLYFVVLIFFIFLGVFRYVSWENAPRDQSLESQIGTKVILEGIVDDEPDIRDGATQILFSVREVSVDSATTSAYGRIKFSVPRYPAYEYGDFVRVKGKLMRPEKFTEDDGRIFDYPAYLAVKGVHYQISFPEIELLRRGEGNSVLAMLFVIKHQFLNTLSSLFPEPENALLGGLLLGGKQSLGDEWQDIFRRAGIVHIVVLSGYNMTIVSEWLVAIFRFLGFYGSLSVGGLGIVFFALMTGAGATVLRAAIMALIALLARATGRTYTMGRALLIAGVFMVIHNPSILAHDPSFQLSFLASLGLIFVSPVIESRTKLFLRFPIWREVFVSTLATQIIVLPLLLYQTGMLSLVSLPVNMLVLPIIPFTMLFGFIAGVVAVAIPMLGTIAAIPAHVSLWWILFAAKSSVQIPYASVVFPISALAVIVLYAALTLYLWRALASLRPAGRGVIPETPPSNSISDKK